MKRAIRYLPVLLLLAGSAVQLRLYGGDANAAPNAQVLRNTFETSNGSEWTLVPGASQSSRTLNAPKGSVWNFNGVKSLRVKAERANAVGGSARLRWLVTSRVGGLYLGPAVPLPLVGVATPTIDFAGDAGELTPVGHQRPWDALAAAEISSLELRAEYTPAAMTTSSGNVLKIALKGAQFEFEKPASVKPEVIDLSLDKASNGAQTICILSFRIHPLPSDPYAASGDGDVRVRFKNGRQALAFLDQDGIEVQDGAASRFAPVGLPIWRAYISEWPTSGSFDIVSGKNVWTIPCAAVHGEDQKSPAKPLEKSPTKNVQPARTGTGTGYDNQQQPKALARLRWDTPLEASAPSLEANWTGSASFWTLNAGGMWLPISLAETLDAFKAKSNSKTGANEATVKNVWRPVPFWNETWGDYAGARRPDSTLARRMDALLETAAKEGDVRPLVLFDGSSLKRQGVFNWASHPLRDKFAGPGTIFRTEEGFDFCARWMRYCLARYAHSPAVSSLLITTDLNAPGAPEFHARLAPLLKDWRAGTIAEKTVIAFHPFTLPPQIVKDIGTFETNNRATDAKWRVDPRLERASGRPINTEGLGGGWCYEVTAVDPSAISVAVQNTYDLEYSDWRKPADDNFFECNALMFEVWIPADAPNDLRVGVHVRDRNGNWFQTLLPGMMRPGDWTTCALDLTALNAHGLTAVNHRSAWTDYSRQRLQEIGLHVYSTHPRFALKSGRIQNLTARFDNIRGVVFPQSAPEPKTEIALVDPHFLQQGAVPPSTRPASTRPASETPGSRTPTREAGRESARTFTRGSLVEYHVNVNKAFANPYDVRDCDLVANIKTPSGKTVRVPAFFNQLCERREASPGGNEIVEPVGGEFFTIRYRAQEVGAHALAFELRERGRYDVARSWEPDDRFTADGEAPAGR